MPPREHQDRVKQFAQPGFDLEGLRRDLIKPVPTTRPSTHDYPQSTSFGVGRVLRDAELINDVQQLYSEQRISLTGHKPHVPYLYPDTVSQAMRVRYGTGQASNKKTAVLIEEIAQMANDKARVHLLQPAHVVASKIVLERYKKARGMYDLHVVLGDMTKTSQDLLHLRTQRRDAERVAVGNPNIVVHVEPRVLLGRLALDAARAEQLRAEHERIEASLPRIVELSPLRVISFR